MKANQCYRVGGLIHHVPLIARAIVLTKSEEKRKVPYAEMKVCVFALAASQKAGAAEI